MFATLESFSIFFFTGLALIILGVIFEEKLIAVENRIAAKLRKNKTVRNKTAVRKINPRKSDTKHTAPHSTEKGRMAA